VQRATAQSKTGIFRDFGVAEAPPGFQAGCSDCMYFFSLSLSLFILLAHLGFPCKFLYSRGYRAVSKLSPDVLPGGGRCLFCSTRRFRTANSTPLVSISCHLTPFDELGWKVITQKGLFQSSAPVHLWASKRSKIVDPTTSRRTETPRERSVLLRRSSIHTETEAYGELVYSSASTGNFRRRSFTFATSSLNPSRVDIATTTLSLLTIYRGCSNVRSTRAY
jgi:hypothetical protein